MRRVPLLGVIPLCLAVPAVVWWLGTREYDFLTPPSAADLNAARAEAVRDIARPAAPIPAAAESDSPAPVDAPPAPPPAPEPPPPVIEAKVPESEPTLESWAEHAGKPAVSFVNLASELEAGAHLAWALPAWERVLDQCAPDEAQRLAALNGIRRLRATLTPPGDAQPTAMTLTVEAPADRVQLTERAAKEAAEIIATATFGQYAVKPSVRKTAQPTTVPALVIGLEIAGQAVPGTSSVRAPDKREELRDAILSSSFKLVSSRLALLDDLSPVSPPADGEAPADSLAFRITRLAWKRLAETTDDAP